MHMVHLPVIQISAAVCVCVCVCVGGGGELYALFPPQVGGRYTLVCTERGLVSKYGPRSPPIRG